MLVAALLLRCCACRRRLRPSACTRPIRWKSAAGSSSRPTGHFRYALVLRRGRRGGRGRLDLRRQDRPADQQSDAQSAELRAGARRSGAEGSSSSMTLEDPGFEWGHPLEAIATDAASDSRDSRLTADDRRAASISAASRAIVAIAPRNAGAMVRPGADLPAVAGSRPSPAVPLSSRTILGKARFDHEPARAARWRPVAERYDTTISLCASSALKKAPGRTSCVADKTLAR